MEKVELKPCPFCGGEAIMERLAVPKWEYRVRCNNIRCKIQPNTWLRKSKEEASEFWNRRAK